MDARDEESRRVIILDEGKKGGHALDFVDDHEGVRKLSNSLKD